MTRQQLVEELAPLAFSALRSKDRDCVRVGIVLATIVECIDGTCLGVNEKRLDALIVEAGKR